VAPLDPVVAQIIPLLPLRDPRTMRPPNAREALRALAAARAHIPPPQVKTTQDVAVRGATGPLAARVYRVSDETAPTVVFFHCGGWVAGDLETHDRQARHLAVETGAVVVSVDYRRPPEVRFPGAFEDAVSAVRDVAGRIKEFGGDPDRLGVAGDSAGAISRQPAPLPVVMPASGSPDSCWSIPSPMPSDISRTLPRTPASHRAARTRTAISSRAP
jgi:acetyl esterase